MVEYAKTLKWNRWAGELDQVVAATRGAIESLKNAGHDDLPLDIRMRTDELTTSGMSLNDLGTISATDLRHLRSLKITVGKPYGDSESVELTLNRSAPAVEAEIKGTDRTLIDGLSAQLHRNLDSGHRFPRWYSRSEIGPFLLPVFAVLPIPLAVMLSTFIRSVGWASRNGRWGSAEIGGLVVGITVPLVLALLTYWLFPDLELLVLGGETRARRYRRAAVATLLTLTGGVIASLIASAVWTAGKK